MVTYGEWIANVYAAYGTEGVHQRLGQWAWNCLSGERIDIANDLLNTEFDCFYSDENLRGFLQEVARRW